MRAVTARLAKRSVLAGALISIGALFSIAARDYGPVVQGMCFSVGLFGVLCCKADLFTGSMLLIRSVWDDDGQISGLVRRWAGIWSGNLVGALCVALMACLMGFDASASACAKAALPWHELLVRAVMCNVMVCMAVHIANNADPFCIDPAMRLASCVLPVACFVACGFEHSVADMLYMPLGLMGGAVTVADCARVIGLATVGNVVGGIAFAWLVWEGGVE